MINITPQWTLFLDRDGVINQRLPGAYVSRSEDFIFNENALEALHHLATIFSRILIVTNQQGIGKGLMTATQLAEVHKEMLQAIFQKGGRIDQIYYCDALAGSAEAGCRKPQTGMALQAKADFPEINFQQSIIVGDSISDMEFGQTLGMKTVFIEGKVEEMERTASLVFDYRYQSLYDWTLSLLQ